MMFSWTALLLICKRIRFAVLDDFLLNPELSPRLQKEFFDRFDSVDLNQSGILSIDSYEGNLLIRNVDRNFSNRMFWEF